MNPVIIELNHIEETRNQLREFLREYNRYLRLCADLFWASTDRQIALDDYPESPLLNAPECWYCADIALAYVEKQDADLRRDIFSIRRAVLKGREEAVLSQSMELQRILARRPVPAEMLPARIRMDNFIFFYTDAWLRLFTLKKDIDIHFVKDSVLKETMQREYPHTIDFFENKMLVYFEDVPESELL